jgi:hypothetical protein
VCFVPALVKNENGQAVGETATTIEREKGKGDNQGTGRVSGESGNQRA